MNLNVSFIIYWKDIAYFHALFWPAMLEASNFRSPNSIYCHGFLTVDGEKMSSEEPFLMQEHI